jgi:50S ribosomal protein L16 3-hydroxylase
MIAWPAGMNPAIFLDRHWQKTPLLIRDALPGFVSPVSPEELAGLACEEDVESRIVRGDQRDGWTLCEGPFKDDDFLSLPRRGWTLLVQDAEKHLPETETLMTLVSFLPSWRCDDLMISYAAPGGSVGPHLDAYDVFLLQGPGSRTWSIDPAPTDTAWRDDCELRVLRHFEVRREVRLRTGDMLYLPPGVAHFGIGEEPSMTFSLGFRSPTAGALLSEAARQLEARDELFYEDPDLTVDEVGGGQISDRAVARARTLMEKAADDAAARAAEHLGRVVTRGKPWVTPLPPESDLTPAELAVVRDGRPLLARHPGSRLAWCREGESVWLFCDGDGWRLSLAAAGFCDALCRLDVGAGTRLMPPNRECRDLLCELLRRGSLELAEGPSP